MTHDPMSRPQACAEALGHHAADAHRFTDKRVLLTGESTVLATANGRWIALDALRLLVRICRHVEVWLPPECRDFRADLEALAREIEFTESVQFPETGPPAKTYDAILSVGCAVTASNVTVINSHGWIARVSSSSDIAGLCDRPNPIAALAAASLGVAEVFKRLVDIRPERGPYADHVSLSLLTLEATEDPGPSLPTLDIATLLLAGQGAIGNGVALLLSQLEVRGSILLLDRQAYGSENLGTCVLLGPTGIGKSKAQANAAWLTAQDVLGVRPLDGEIEELHERFGRELPWPRIVLGALDNVEARHALQDLWPDVMIDGAIGDFSCQSVTHVWGTEMACLKCLFDVPVGIDPALAASAETGLPSHRIGDAESIVTAEDVNGAPPEKREFLQRNLGHRICSLVSDAMRAKVSRDTTSVSFSPSVPFVATMSAALSVAALARHLLGYGSDPARYYLDLLIGPVTAERFNEQARPECYCVSRRTLISRYRSASLA